MKVFSATESDLTSIAILHSRVFASSISSRLGFKFCRRSFQWYLNDSRCFLIFLMNDTNEIIGYCGGMLALPGKPGSATSMIQFAFKQAVLGFLRKPWLLFHSEVRCHWPLVLRNVKLKMGLRTRSPRINPKPKLVSPPSMGLVVIGVAPEARNQGIGQVLLAEFERFTRSSGVKEAHLSVKKNNHQAHRAYSKSGWIRSAQVESDNYIYTKLLI